MDFENHLYTALQRLGQQDCLRKLVTLDLANPSTGMDSVGLLISSRLVKLSRFSPHLQHLCLPEVTLHPLMAGPLHWPNFLVWFRSLRSFSLDSCDAQWKARPVSLAPSPPVCSPSGDPACSSLGFETPENMSATIAFGMPLLVGDASRRQALTALADGVSADRRCNGGSQTAFAS
jgi:hypothetical protein